VRGGETAVEPGDVVGKLVVAAGDVAGLEEVGTEDAAGEAVRDVVAPEVEVEGDAGALQPDRTTIPEREINRTMAKRKNPGLFCALMFPPHPALSRRTDAVLFHYIIRVVAYFVSRIANVPFMSQVC
jgi:hypothetical protein